MSVRSNFLITLFLLGFVFTLQEVSCEKDDASFPGTELVHAFVVFRHGDRTPHEVEVLMFPKGPQNTNYAPYGYKALTKAGKLRAYRLGESLRARYNGVLDQCYNESQLIMNATKVQRARMSALCVLAGMYPPPPDMMWFEGLKWNPVPYTEHPKEGRDFVNCPKHVYKLAPELLGDPEVKKRIDSFQPLFRRLSEATGGNITNTFGVAKIREGVRAMHNYGYPIPLWYSELQDKIDEAAAFDLLMNHYNDELTRLSGGSYMYDFVRVTEKVVSGGIAKPKVQLLSAHEVTVFAFMSAARVFHPPHVPKYSAAIALELRKNTTSGEFGIAAIYLPSPGEDVQVLRMRGCGESAICDYRTFLNVTSATRMSREKVVEACRYNSLEVFTDH